MQGGSVHGPTELRRSTRSGRRRCLAAAAAVAARGVVGIAEVVGGVVDASAVAGVGSSPVVAPASLRAWRRRRRRRCSATTGRAGPGGRPGRSGGRRADAGCPVRSAIVRNEVWVMSRAPPTTKPMRTTMAPAGGQQRLQRLADERRRAGRRRRPARRARRSPRGRRTRGAAPSVASATSDQPIDQAEGAGRTAPAHERDADADEDHGHGVQPEAEQPGRATSQAAAERPGQIEEHRPGPSSTPPAMRPMPTNSCSRPPTPSRSSRRARSVDRAGARGVASDAARPAAGRAP